MRYTVLYDNVLAYPLEEKQDDIVVAEEDNNLIRASVDEIGNGAIHYGQREPMEVRPTSIIWFDKRDAILFPVARKTAYLIKQKNILVVEEDQ